MCRYRTHDAVASLSHVMNRRDFVVFAALTAFIPYAKAGAWESGSFDNDDAPDWAGQCVESKGHFPYSRHPQCGLGRWLS